MSRLSTVCPALSVMISIQNMENFTIIYRGTDLHSRVVLCLLNAITVTFNEDNEEFQIIIKNIPFSCYGSKLGHF